MPWSDLTERDVVDVNGTGERRGTADHDAPPHVEMRGGRGCARASRPRRALAAAPSPAPEDPFVVVQRKRTATNGSLLNS